MVTEQAQHSLGVPAASRLPILAVDDYSENLVALEAVLAPLGFEVVTASSGEEALRLLLEREFELILLDVRMPGMDGIETARLIKDRERSRDVPILFLTAARDEMGDILRGYGVGAVDYVLKPIDAELLRSKVAVFAALEQSRRALEHSEALLRGAFEAAPIGKTVLDVDRSIVRANPAFARLVGRAEDELDGAPLDQLIHPDDRVAFSTVLDRSGKEPRPESRPEAELGLDLRLVDPMGREKWVAPTASAIAHTEISSPLLLVQWVDVDARRRAEHARGELLLEQAARIHAEAQADRLEKLHRLGDAIETRSLEDLLPELARRLVVMFDAVAADVEIDQGIAGREPTRARIDHSHHLPAGDRAAPDWAEAPMEGHRGRIGTVRIALPQGRPMTTAQRTLLRDAADQIALVVGRVQLHEREHRIAVELQRGLLPAGLPDLTGIEIAAHYEAAGAATEVGGDWYDAFAISGGRLGVVVGDVTGSGVDAASAMGQLRSVMRAFAVADPDSPTPSEVLTRLQRYNEKLGFEKLFTLLYLILDPAERTIVWANAGHPPPLLRTSTGEVRALQGAEAMMAISDVRYHDRHERLGAGDTVILYTDGLVERRGEAIDAGLERLAEAIKIGPLEPDGLCAHILECAAAPAGQSDDDVTAVILRLAPAAHQEHDQITLVPDRNVPSAARRFLEQCFGDSVDRDALDRAKLAVSELATNAVRHGRGQVTIRADLNEERLQVEVIDEGQGFEHLAPAGDPGTVGGWGLKIVDAEATRWGIREGASHVWFEIERNRSAQPSERAVV